MEELAPAGAQQRHLAGHRQLWEEGGVARPLNGAEEQPHRLLSHRPAPSAPNAPALKRLDSAGFGLAPSSCAISSDTGCPGKCSLPGAASAQPGGAAQGGGHGARQRVRDAAVLHRLLTRAHPEALLQEAVLAQVILVDLAVMVGAAGVAAVAVDALLEAALAALAGEVAVSACRWTCFHTPCSPPAAGTALLHQAQS